MQPASKAIGYGKEMEIVPVLSNVDRPWEGGDVYRYGLYVTSGQEAPALDLLIRNLGQVVSRDEIRNAVWGPGCAASDQMINRLKERVAAVLGPEYKRYFKAPRRAGWILQRTQNEARPAQQLPKVAFLPFEIVSAEGEATFIADGISALLAERCRAAGLTVSDWASTQSKTKLPRGLTHTVSGKVIYEGGKAVVILEIRDVIHTKEYPLGPLRFNVSRGKIIHFARRVAPQLAELVTRTFVHESIKGNASGEVGRESFKPSRMDGRISRSTGGTEMSHTIQPEAETEYLRGRFHWSKVAVPDVMQALGCFERAAKCDPDFALAHAGIADAYTLLGLAGAIAPEVAYAKAVAGARMSIRLDPSLPEGHISMAAIKGHFEFDWRGSERESLNAIDLDSKNPTAHHGYAMASLIPLERFTDARREISIAAALQPDSVFILTCVGIVCFYQHMYEDALHYFEEALYREPQFRLAHWHKGWALQAKGDVKGAIADLEKAAGVPPQPSPQIMSALANAYATYDKKVEAQRILQDLERLGKERYVSPFEFAVIYAGFRKHQKTFQKLDAAIEDRTPAVSRLRVHPLFTQLHKDPEFRRLLTKVGLQT